MGKCWATIAALGILVGIASSGFAQSVPEPSPPVLPSHAIAIDSRHLPMAPGLAEPDLVELASWMDEFAEWQEWSAEWRGRRQPGLFTAFRDRPTKPAPPEWLASWCEAVFDETDRLVPACTMLTEWRDDRAAVQNRQARATVLQREEEPKITWWEHVHMDVLWPAMQWKASVYGVVGMHVATKVGKRLHVFTAPGALLLNLPARNGTRVWKVATNYGIGYRMFDFRLPGSRPAELHLNLAKTWIFGDTADLLTGRSIDVVGFSITFKKSR